MERIIRIGIDTSKHIFQLQGVYAAEEPALRKKLRCKEEVAFFEPDGSENVHGKHSRPILKEVFTPPAPGIMPATFCLIFSIISCPDGHDINIGFDSKHSPLEFGVKQSCHLREAFRNIALRWSKMCTNRQPAPRGNRATREFEMKRAMTMTFVVAIALSAMAAATAIAGPLTDRIAAGKPIRLGFANEVPTAYPGKNGEPEGYANIMTLDVLKKMGYEKIESVQTEWGGLIPGLQAGRFDIITGGMFILAPRCENVAFAEPIYKMGEAFLIPKGNPKGLRNYDDVRKSGAIMVTGAGYANIQHAKAAGVDAAKIMEVPGPTEILAAVRAGRADAGAATPDLVGELVASSGGELEATDAAAMGKDSYNWGGIAFSKEDQDFVAAFNAALKGYLGSEQMMKAVAKYGYTKDWLPGDEKTEWICANR